jgi:uncharacterized membrane protein YeaQ/YmgE (transglycosylase-associated protein family)
MSLTFAQVASWLVIGLLGGSLAALIVKRERRGFGLVTNLALGCLGAIVGGALFRWLGIFPELDSISISLRDLLSALLGSLLVLGVIWIWQRRRSTGREVRLREGDRARS